MRDSEMIAREKEEKRRERENKYFILTAMMVPRQISLALTKQLS